MTDIQHRFRVPHPLVLLTGCIILASMASYVLPAGEYERSMDEETGKIAVVSGTYEQVEQTPVNVFLAMVALPRGMVDAGGVIFLVFLIGGALTVVDETGALRRGISSLVRALKGRDLLILAAISLFFATGGVVQNMQEEIIPLIPVVLIVTSRLGFTPLVAMSISAGAAFVGSAFSPINPFQVLIAQDAAGVTAVSGWPFRVVFLLIALVFWIGMTMRYAIRTRVAPEIGSTEDPEDALGWRDWVILLMLLCTFALMGYLARIGFNHMSGAFFIMGVLAGAVSGMGPSRIAQAYVNGFRQMAYAALLIGFARTIYVVLLDGRIIDTIVYGMFQPLESLPSLASALGMVVAQAAIHVPIPSVSSPAVLTLPVLIPLSDLLEISRQVTVLAYQYGAGLCDLITPTNGALMAILAAGGVRYEDWIKFTVPLYLGLIALGGVAIAVGISINLQ